MENFKVTKHQVLKSISGMQLSCAINTLQIFWAKPDNPREGGKKGVTNGEGEARAKPGNQLVSTVYIIQILSVCVSVKYGRPNCWTDHNQIWHAYADSSGDGSYLKKLTQGGVEVGILGGPKIKCLGNVINCP